MVKIELRTGNAGALARFELKAPVVDVSTTLNEGRWFANGAGGGPRSQHSVARLIFQDYVLIEWV